jgi:hypothetical protein
MTVDALERAATNATEHGASDGHRTNIPTARKTRIMVSAPAPNPLHQQNGSHGRVGRLI